MKNYAYLKKILTVLILGCQALFAQAVTFYFLPPSEDNWIAGNSYLYNDSTGKAEPMKIDTAGCGWFKITFTSKAQIPAKVLIYLGSLGRDKLDMNGRGAGLENPTWIPLRDKFGTATALYSYFADTLALLPGLPPYNSLNEEAEKRCSYKMAAYIYDTDEKVNPSFHGTYVASTNGNGGIRRGIVASTLDTTGGKRKPVFVANNGYAGWVNRESFDAAFTPKGEYNGKISNIPRCYNMPFSRVTNGTWEFDSDKMRTTQAPPPNYNLPVGGFYPYILDPTYNLDDDGTEVDYDAEGCSACNTTYTANCFNSVSSAVANVATNPNAAAAIVTPITRNGETYRGIEAFDRTYLADGWSNGWTPARTPNYNVYSAGNYGCTTPRAGFDGSTTAKVNLSFCFESHAEFVYEKGQEFFFRGDDDIWVFINNQLVIDLGGVHMPAPGFVDLDTIKTPEPLVEGQRYPIDIFFCERMATQSNVRVSTNMYIVQKSSFYSDPKKRDHWMCTSKSGGNACENQMGGASEDLCGNNLIKGGFTVDFYMIERSSQDTTYLTDTGSKKPVACNGTGAGRDFTCFKKDDCTENCGIKVENAVYICGGAGQCKGNPTATGKVELLPGNYTVYARLMENGKQVDGSKPLIIDNIKSETSPRIVWGNLKSLNGQSENLVLKDTYDSITKMEQRIIAGKRTPIYIARGLWNANASFDYDSDSAAAVLNYSLSGTKLPSGAGLKVYFYVAADSVFKEATFPRPFPRIGIDTLWVMGDYESGEAEFSINVNDVLDAPLKLTVYQPELRFTDSSYTTKISSSGYYNPSGYPQWGTMRNDGLRDTLLPPFIGNPLDVYVVAWDSERNRLCDHCSFILSETSFTNNEEINGEWAAGIIQSDAVRIENGKQFIYIRGADVVEGADSATWRISGPSAGLTFAEWTGLQFRKAPVPLPSKSHIFDRNGNGIGDSLVVEFSKSFYEGNDIADSLLPVLLEVVWEKGYSVYYYYNPDGRKPDDLKKEDYVKEQYKDPEFRKNNKKYWEKYIKGVNIISIAEPTTAFSKGILTSGYDFGKGDVKSYTPFNDPGKCGFGNPNPTCGFTWRADGYKAPVFDSIPPIVMKAVYTMDKTKNCADNNTPGCREKITVYLSEPVFVDSAATVELVKNPFSYCFEYSSIYYAEKSKCQSTHGDVQRHDLDYRNDDWDWEEPKKYSVLDSAHSVVYKPSDYKPNGQNSPPRYSKGDSTLELTYYAYKVGSEMTRMPKGSDWIKIRPPSSVTGGSDVFRDAAGNSANPREIGVSIIGANYYRKDQIKIADINPRDTLPLNGIFIPGGKKPEWISEPGRIFAQDNLFRPGNVSEFLPVPKGHPVDLIKEDYPKSVGTVFDIAETIHNEVDKILNECREKVGSCTNIKGEPLNENNIAEGITIHASAFYHTNIGNYTAHRNPVVAKCTDPIFQKDGVDGGGDCYTNHYNFYLAWDLRANSGRFVGVGAYVGISTFYWQIEYKNANGTVKVKGNKDEFVDMYGVRRGKLQK